jgi:hypothetical protein
MPPEVLAVDAVRPRPEARRLLVRRPDRLGGAGEVHGPESRRTGAEVVSAVGDHAAASCPQMRAGGL